MDTRRLTSAFEELVRIDSLSRHEAGVAYHCEGLLRDMGFSVRFDASAAKTGSDTGNLIACRRGELPSSVVLAAHMDCVAPCNGVVPVCEDGVYRSAGDTVLGADDKAGIAAILEGVACALSSGRDLPTIFVLLTTCEELSLLGAKHLDEDALYLDGVPTDAPCVVFDADGAPGTIVLGAPYHYTFAATFKGRAAHAGVEPENGISAIAMASDAISRMRLGRLDKRTTANVGLIQGGREVNIVADSCWVSGECRSLYADRVEAARAQLTESMEAAAAAAGGSVDVEWTVDYPGVLYDADDPLVAMLERAAESVGLPIGHHISGGGADANLLALRGVRPITVSIGMTDFHTPGEHITVEDLENSARFAEAVIYESADMC